MSLSRFFEGGTDPGKRDHVLDGLPRKMREFERESEEISHDES